MLPTFRRPARLRLALAGVAAQSGVADLEVVVVDNDPASTARAVVESAPLPARYLVEPRSGAVHARNTGIEAARGEVVVLLDDDVVPREGWLAALLAPIVGGDADATGGRVVLDPAVARPRWFDEPVVGQYLTNVDLGPGPRLLGGDEFVVTANAAFRRELLVAVGGFATNLGPRGTTQLVNDDVRLVRDVQRHGGRVWWVPDAVVEHELPASRLRPRWVLRRAYLQGRSDWLLDEADLRRRRGNGVRVAASWLFGELAARGTEGLTRPDVAFHAACDVARSVGRVRQGMTWWLRERGAPTAS